MVSKPISTTDLDVRFNLDFPSEEKSLFTTELYRTQSFQTFQSAEFWPMTISSISPKRIYKIDFEEKSDRRNGRDNDYSIWYEIWLKLKEKKIQLDNSIKPLQSCFKFPAWVQDSCNNLENGDMRLCESGVGGTYFVNGERNDGADQILSVFKPIDEEPGSPNNPKKKNSFIPLLKWGGGAFREVAAFRLGGSFVDIPETYLITITNSDGSAKKGSLQKYIQNDGDCSDVGANRFSVDTVHRIGLFDVRILNMDRNDENLLVQKISEKEWKLFPIDHTYAFPHKIDSYFNWQFWSQTKIPFSNEILSYISAIDVESDAQMLLECGIEEKSVQNVIASTILLQKAAKVGFNLYEIASMVSGKQNDLVDLISKTRTKYHKNEKKEEKEEILSLSGMERLRIFQTIAEEKINTFIHERVIIRKDKI